MRIRSRLSVAVFLGAMACLPSVAVCAPSESTHAEQQPSSLTPNAEVKLGLKLVSEGLELAPAKKKADTIRAMALFRRAYAQGDPDGAWYLGNAYSSTGIGITPNPIEAKHWMRLGVNGSGNRMAAYALLLPTLDRGTGQNGYKAQEHWLRKAAEHGSTVGMVLLANEEAGLEEASKHGVPIDRNAAKRWMLRAARAGNVDAQVLFGEGMIRGVFGPTDADAGLRWLRAAANRGSGPAAGLLALHLIRGDGGVRQNSKEGLEWAIKAAQRHNSFGYVLLGKAEQAGIDGKTPDPAAALYDFAAAQRIDPSLIPHLKIPMSQAEAPLSPAESSRILAQASKIPIPKHGGGDSVEVLVRTVPPGWAQ